MSSIDKTKNEILELVETAKTLIPKSLPPNIEPIEDSSSIPKWHDFENKIWEIGEQIRQKMNSKVSLRADNILQDKFIEIIKNRKAKRGRQSFIMLLAYKACSSRSKALLSELKDPDVEGQVIYTWRKMQTSAHIRDVLPYLGNSKQWVKHEEKKYICRYGKI